jgi:hypothetical protein
MRKFFGLFVAALLTVLVAEQANAFCLYSCTPSESNARAVFENLVKLQFRGSPYNVVSFEKTNGVEREMFGQKAYELSFKAVIELPNGANLDCKKSPTFDFQNFNAVNQCAASNRRYWPPGQKLNYSESYTFEKTERGWKAPDGALY